MGFSHAGCLGAHGHAHALGMDILCAPQTMTQHGQHPTFRVLQMSIAVRWWGFFLIFLNFPVDIFQNKSFAGS